MSALEAVLEKKDEEIRKLEGEVDRLENELRGSASGWRVAEEWKDVAEEWKDDGTLPIPRLEFVYQPSAKGWGSYVVIYRLVYQHLCDQMIGVPLGHTRVDGTGGKPEGLPFRDGAHAAHDSALLGLPIYKLMPGKDPDLVTFDDHNFQRKLGASRRRGAK